MKRKRRKLKLKASDSAGTAPKTGPSGGEYVVHLRRAMPVSRSIRWTPTTTDRRDDDADAGSRYEVFISQAALREVTEHVWETDSKAHWGFLLGVLFQCPKTDRRYAVIESVLRGNAPFEEANEAVILGAAWPAMERERSRIGAQLVGWYHSHPHLGVVVSEADAQSHLHRFPEPWQCMLVMTLAGSDAAGGFFCGTGRGSLARRHPIPFYELLEPESIQQNGVKRTLIGWNNYATDEAVMEAGARAAPAPVQPAVATAAGRPAAAGRDAAPGPAESTPEIVEASVPPKAEARSEETVTEPVPSMPEPVEKAAAEPGPPEPEPDVEEARTEWAAAGSEVEPAAGPAAERQVDASADEPATEVEEAEPAEAGLVGATAAAPVESMEVKPPDATAAAPVESIGLEPPAPAEEQLPTDETAAGSAPGSESVARDPEPERQESDAPAAATKPESGERRFVATPASDQRGEPAAAGAARRRVEKLPHSRVETPDLVIPEGVDSTLVPFASRANGGLIGMLAALGVLFVVVYLMNWTSEADGDLPDTVIPVETAVNPAVGRFEAQLDALDQAITSYGEREIDFDLGRINCDGLGLGYQEADDSFVETSRAFVDSRPLITLRQKERYDALVTRMDAVNLHFDESGCPRPE